MGTVERGLRDVIRRQYIKNSTGKLLFLPSGLTIKTQGEWLQRSVLGPPLALARLTDKVSIGCFTKNPEVKRKADRLLPLDLMLYSNTNTCAANTYRLSILIVTRSYLQNRGRGSVKG